jgi:short-subunit dehydrogenase
VVAGASEGLGAAFATELSRRGLGVVLAARRSGALADLAATLPGPSITVATDLATGEGLDALAGATAGIQVGLVVANAAYAPIGPFLSLDADQARRALALNCAAPVELARRFLPAMVARGRGGFVVMSSLSGLQGTPPITLYAATKAFGAVLAEGLWAELRGSGVDVVTCVAGAIRTPGLSSASAREAPGTLDADRVVAAALRGLGRGPRTGPGAVASLSQVVMSRLLPRRAAIAIISRASRGLTPPVP